MVSMPQSNRRRKMEGGFFFMKNPTFYLTAQTSVFVLHLAEFAQEYSYDLLNTDKNRYEIRHFTDSLEILILSREEYLIEVQTAGSLDIYKNLCGWMKRKRYKIEFESTIDEITFPAIGLIQSIIEQFAKQQNDNPEDEAIRQRFSRIANRRLPTPQQAKDDKEFLTAKAPGQGGVTSPLITVLPKTSDVILKWTMDLLSEKPELICNRRILRQPEDKTIVIKLGVYRPNPDRLHSREYDLANEDVISLTLYPDWPDQTMVKGSHLPGPTTQHTLFYEKTLETLWAEMMAKFGVSANGKAPGQAGGNGAQSQINENELDLGKNPIVRKRRKEIYARRDKIIDGVLTVQMLAEEYTKVTRTIEEDLRSLHIYRK